MPYTMYCKREIEGLKRCEQLCSNCEEYYAGCDPIVSPTTKIISEVFAELQNICGVSEASLKSSSRKGMLSRYRSMFFNAVGYLTSLKDTQIPLILNRTRFQKRDYMKIHENEMSTSDEYRELYYELILTLDGK